MVNALDDDECCKLKCTDLSLALNTIILLQAAMVGGRFTGI